MSKTTTPPADYQFSAKLLAELLEKQTEFANLKTDIERDLKFIDTYLQSVSEETELTETAAITKTSVISNYVREVAEKTIKRNQIKAEIAKILSAACTI